MRSAHYERLKRYALFAVLHGGIVLVVLTGVFGIDGGVVVLVASLPLVWAWGAYQADLALNSTLGESERQRWRIALWVMPWSMAVYFQRHIRHREVF